jgi:hypothetical protein
MDLPTEDEPDLPLISPRVASEDETSQQIKRRNDAAIYLDQLSKVAHATYSEADQILVQDVQTAAFTHEAALMLALTMETLASPATLTLTDISRDLHRDAEGRIMRSR